MPACFEVEESHFEALFSRPPPPFLVFSTKEKLTIELKLEKELKAAMEADDFDKCEMLQALIDARKEAVAALEDAKSARRFADAKAAKAALDKLPATLAEYMAVGPPFARHCWSTHLNDLALAYLRSSVMSAPGWPSCLI